MGRRFLPPPPSQKEPLLDRHCAQCQAISKSTNVQCRNPVQCHVKFTTGTKIELCNVHAARMKRHGPSSVKLVSDRSDSYSKRAPNVDDRVIISIEQLDRIEKEQKDQKNQLNMIVESLRKLTSLDRIVKQEKFVDVVKQEKFVDIVKQEPFVDVAKQEPFVDVAKQEPFVDVAKQESFVDVATVPFDRPSRLEFDRSEQLKLDKMREIGVFSEDLVATARIVHAEIATTLSLAKSLCSNVDSNKIEAIVKPLVDWSNALDKTIANARDNALINDYPGLNKLREELQIFKRQFQKESEQSRQALEKECDPNRKSNKFTFRPSLEFALNLAGGAILCNGDSIPPALRNWYLQQENNSAAATTNNEPFEWKNRRLLCNMEGSDRIVAFKKGQELQKNYSVYDIRNQVIAIGQKQQKQREKAKDKEAKASSLDESEQQQSKQTDKISNAEQMLRQYSAWIVTLALLIELYGAIGLDTSSLVYEKLNINVSMGTLALTVGRAKALEYMSESQYETLTSLASLSGTYASYLEQPDGVVGLATLAAFSVDQKLKQDSSVDEKTRRRAARMAYSRAVVALTLIGSGGLLAYLRWYAAAAAPRTPYRNAPADTSDVPIEEVGRNGTDVFKANRMRLDRLEKDRAITNLNWKALNTTVSDRLRNYERRMRAEIRAATISGVLENPDALMTVFFPQLTTPGGRLFPMTREQFKQAQLETALRLISPGSADMKRVFRQTTEVIARLAKKQQQGTATKRQELPQKAQPIVYGLPEGFRLPGEAIRSLSSDQSFAQQSSLFESDLSSYSTAVDAGSSLLGLVGLLPQVVSGTSIPPVYFPPEIESVMRNARQLDNESRTVQSPLANPSIFRSGNTVVNATQSGMTAVRTFQLVLETPGTNARLDDPDVTRAMLSAILPARKSINDTELMFDDVSLPDLDEALTYVTKNNIFAAAESPVQFLKSVAGTTAGGLTGRDMARLQRRLTLIEMGIGNSTAIDLHLQEAFEEFSLFESTTLAISADVELLVDLTSRLGQSSNKVLEKISESTNRLLQTRAVRGLLDSPAALHGFLVGVAEKEMQKTIKELETTSGLENAILHTLHSVQEMSIATASVVSRQISTILSSVERNQLQNVNSSDQFDRLLAQQFKETLQVGTERAQQLAAATTASLRSSFGSISALSQESKSKLLAFTENTLEQTRSYAQSVASYGDQLSTASVEQATALGNKFVENSRQWAEVLMSNAKKTAGEQMKIELASQKFIRDQIIVLETVAERSIRQFSLAVGAQVKKLQTVMTTERQESTKNRQKTAIERKLDRLAKKLALEAQKTLEENNRQLAVREETLLRLQRESLFANILADAKREQAERDLQKVLRKTRRDYVDATLTNKNISTLFPSTKNNETTASEELTKLNAATSVYTNEWELEMTQRSSVDKQMTMEAQKLSQDYQKSVENSTTVEEMAKSIAADRPEVAPENSVFSWLNRGMKHADEQISMRACMAGLPIDAPGWKKAIAYYGLRPDAMLDEAKIARCSSLLNLSAAGLAHYMEMAKIESEYYKDTTSVPASKKPNLDVAVKTQVSV